MIKKVFRKFDIKCMQMSDLKYTFYILGLILIYFIVTIPIEILVRGVENLPNVSYFDDTGILPLFLSVVVIMPYIETIVFHTIPLGLYYKLKSKFELNKHWDFIVGGLCGLNFGILHAINYPEFLMKGFNFTIIGSLYAYVFFRYKRLGQKSVYGIWIIHALNNLIAIGPRLIKILLTK